MLTVPRRSSQEQESASQPVYCTLDIVSCFLKFSSIGREKSKQEGESPLKILPSPTYVVLSARTSKRKHRPLASLNEGALSSCVCGLSPSPLMSVVINRSLSRSPCLHSGLSTFLKSTFERKRVGADLQQPCKSLLI